MTRTKSLIVGALGLGAVALASTGASAQNMHRGGFGGFHGGVHGGFGGYRGGYYGGHRGFGGGFWPAAVAVGALTGALGAVSYDDGYGYGYGYGAYPAYEPYPAYGYADPYAYPIYGAYPVTYAPAYYGRRFYAPRRIVRGYNYRMAPRNGVIHAGYRMHR